MSYTQFGYSSPSNYQANSQQLAGHQSSISPSVGGSPLCNSSLTSPVASASCHPGADSGSGSSTNGGRMTGNGGSATVSPVVSPPIQSGSALGGGHAAPSSSGINFSAASLASNNNNLSGNITGNPATAISGSGSASGLTDPVTGQLLADCDPARLAALSYPRLSAGGLGPMYTASYPSTDQNPYPSIAMENSFYGSLGNPYAMKDGTAGAAGADMSAAAAWSSAAALQPTAGYYGYDHPTLAAYGYGGGYDLASRRKNATRESTATLKAWLSEHKKNPYPTKGEKIMLAIITKMTLTQVSTWFANARRRLKKENKMTWEPKNKLDDEDVDVSDDDDKDDDKDDDPRSHMTRPGELGSHGVGHHGMDDSSKSGIPIPPSKPKIWSLADTAVCKTPPPPPGSHSGGLGNLNHNPHPQSTHHMGAQNQYGMPHSSASGFSSFSQFDPSVVRPGAMSAALRGNMFGMNPMGMAGLGHHGFSGMMGASSGLPVSSSHHTSGLPSASSAQLPAASPSVSALSGSSELQTDTPPHTPPTGGNKLTGASASSAATGGSNQYNGSSYNGVQNGYGNSQVSPNASMPSSDPSSASKLLQFQGLGMSHHLHNSSFKMM